MPWKVLHRIIPEWQKEGRMQLTHSYEASRQACAETSHVQVRLQLWALYVNFVDYEKAFESMDRWTLWKLLWQTKLVNLIKNSYQGMTCKESLGGQFTDSFQAKTGVRQGCLLSPFFFLLDHEEVHGTEEESVTWCFTPSQPVTEEEWNPVQIVDASRWPRLQWWFSTVFL